jgi:Ras-related protein Rab-5C
MNQIHSDYFLELIPKYTFKCVFLGSCGSGKTSIIQSYVNSTFRYDTMPTIGAAFNSKIIRTDTIGDIKLNIWDTAGQERFDPLVFMYYKSSDIVFIVYDITCKDSYIRAKEWIDKLYTNNHILILVGNKLDLHDKRKISCNEAQIFAKDSNILFFECSAKSRINISNIFEFAYIAKINQLSRAKSLMIESKSEIQTQKRSKCCCWF